MGRKSSIELLPKEIVDEINKHLRDNLTLDDIVEKLDKLGVDVSRSAIHRHSRKFDEVMQRLNDSRAMADALVENFGDASESKLSRANIDLMHSALLKIGLETDGMLEPKEVLALSKSLEALAKAKKIDQDTIIEAAKIMQKKAAKAVDKAAVSMGMTAETREKFNKIIFGLEV